VKTADVLDSIPPAESIRLKLQANREEADALKKMLKIAVRRETAQDLRSRSVQTAGR
jgi:hypothetical protein